MPAKIREHQMLLHLEVRIEFMPYEKKVLRNDCQPCLYETGAAHGNPHGLGTHLGGAHRPAGERLLLERLESRSSSCDGQATPRHWGWPDLIDDTNDRYCGLVA